MFDEYTDPYDIDNYYGEVGKIFTKIADYVDPTKPITVQPVSSPPTIQDNSSSTLPQNASSAPAISKFEVSPNSIFIDDHPVGSQPKYNILQSGPPEKESYHNHRCCSADSASVFGGISTPMWLLLFVIFIYIVYLQSQIRTHNMILHMLMYEVLSKKK